MLRAGDGDEVSVTLVHIKDEEGTCYKEEVEATKMHETTEVTTEVEAYLNGGNQWAELIARIGEDDQCGWVSYLP